MILPFMTRYLTPTDYGVLSVCNSVTMITGLVATLALDRAIPLYYCQLKPEEFRRFLLTIALLSGVAPLLLLALGAGCGPFLGAVMFPRIPWFPYIQLALLVMYLGIIPGVFLALVQARQQAMYYVTLSLASSIATTFWMMILVGWCNQGAAGSLWGQILGGGLGTVYAYWSIVRFCRPWPRPAFDLRQVQAALRFCLPYMPYSVCMWLLNISDRWILVRYVSLAELGVYGLAYSIGMILISVGSSLAAAFVPMYFQQADQPEFRRRLPQLVSVYALVPTWFALALSLLAPELLRCFTRPAYYGAAVIVPWIALAYWLHIAIYQLQIVVIDYHRRTELILWLTAPAAFLNIVLNIALVPRFGIRAAALNTVVGFVYTSAMARWFAVRLGPIAYPWTTITANAAVAVVAYGLGITFLTGPGLVESIVAKGMLLVAAGAIMLPICGFSPRDAVRLLETLRRPIVDDLPAMADT